MGRNGTVEEWRPCPFRPDLYEVSSLGRVRSWNNNRWGRRPSPRVLTAQISPDGYAAVSMGRGVVKRINRLVCEAFHGAPADGMEAAHKDGDTLNNCAENLRWATALQNTADKRAHGTLVKGSRIGAAKLTEPQVMEIVQLRRAGVPGVKVAQRFAVSQMAISNIMTGQRWGWLTGIDGDGRGA